MPAKDLAQMVEVGTKWHGMTQEELPLPLNRTGAPAWSTEEQSPPGPCYINHLQYCDGAFARLVLNPKIMRVVSALTAGNCAPPRPSHSRSHKAARCALRASLTQPPRPQTLWSIPR